MNKYIFVLIVCAVVFLICFLIDTLFKVIFPKSKLEKSKQVVRPPRKSAVAGVILTFAGVAVLIKNLAGTPDTLFLIGSSVAIIFGAGTADVLYKKLSDLAAERPQLVLGDIQQILSGMDGI